MVLNVQKSLVGYWMTGWKDNLELKVEVKVSIEGLTAALSLGVKRIDSYCDYYPLYQYVGHWSLLGVIVYLRDYCIERDEDTMEQMSKI
ncbi:hypothetical protein Scep_021954 [Stephania cephalantha]|uniref:Uncharacterized protein n=1 Tax=Stephania cephalantha TaxID=152367 RepID=A0AAP0F705_9MAGN